MPDERLSELVKAVRAKSDYRQISEDLIRWIGEGELQKRRNLKEAIKHTRSRLHQVGGAYQGGDLDYSRWLEALEALPSDLDGSALQEYCRLAMALHASTRERLSILDEFFSLTLQAAAPVKSVLDIGCGLNPLALPWMPLKEGARYIGLDIYTDMAAFLNRFLSHLHVPGEVWVYNLVNGLPPDLPHVQVAMMLKTIPCLEQLDKNVTERLLNSLRADFLLISYPLHSLGGRAKGMLMTYENHFRGLAEGRSWQAERFQFKTELAFLVPLARKM